MRQLHTTRCGLTSRGRPCENEAVRMIAGVRVCAHHLQKVRAIVANATRLSVAADRRARQRAKQRAKERANEPPLPPTDTHVC